MSGERLARFFFVFAVACGAAVIALTLLSAAGVLPIAGFMGLFRGLIYRFGLVLLAGVVSAVVLMIAALRENGGGRAPLGLGFASSPFLIRGLCASTALGFIATEIGKLLHLGEMREFFTSSGLPVALLYVVMAAETIGSVGLLVPSVRLVATLGLSAIMVGAVGTHVHNGDPWSDSYEALHMLAVLGTILLVGVLRDRSVRGGVIESRATSLETK